MKAETSKNQTWVDFRTFRDRVDVFDRIELMVNHTVFHDWYLKGVDLNRLRDQLNPICMNLWSLGYLGEVIYFSSQEDYDLVRLIYG